MRKLSVLFTLLLAGCNIEIDGFNNEQFQKDFRFSYPLKPGATLTLETMNGSVDIAGWDREEVEITGVKYARSETLRDETKIDIQHSDSSINIRTVAPSSMNSGVGARYVIRLPRKVTLDRVTSSNGKIHVSDIEGTVKLKSSNGSIQLSKVAGSADAQTSNASVDANDIQGAAHLHTTNSHVTAEGVKGPIDATSSNGSINISLSTGVGEVQAHTSNSSITVRLPSSAPARIRASTSNGHITTEFENANNDDRRHLDAPINGGGSNSPLLDLSTSNGNIRIEKL